MSIETETECDEMRRELGKLESLVGNVRDELKSFRESMLENMKKLTEATLQVAKLEMTIVQHGDSMQRGFKRLEELEGRQIRLETDLAAWVNKGRGVWFAITFIVGSMGVGGGYMITLFDRAAVKFMDMQDRINRIEFLLERNDNDDKRRRSSSAIGSNSQPGADRGKIVPIPLPIPETIKPPIACNTEAC